MSYKLKSVTDKSWIVISDTEETKIGLLTEIRSKYILMIAGVKQQFLNKEEVVNFFKEDVFKDVPPLNIQPEVSQHYVKGYAVDFETPIEVQVVGNTLPLFSKSEKSTVYFCAGYYCLHFPKNIMAAFCPKLSTPLYGHLGRFGVR